MRASELSIGAGRRSIREIYKARQEKLGASWGFAKPQAAALTTSDRHPGSALGARVACPGADQAVVVELLDDVRTPA